MVHFLRAGRGVRACFVTGPRAATACIQHKLQLNRSLLTRFYISHLLRQQERIGLLPFKHTRRQHEAQKKRATGKIPKPGDGDPDFGCVCGMWVWRHVGVGRAGFAAAHADNTASRAAAAAHPACPCSEKTHRRSTVSAEMRRSNQAAAE